jgi:hypothetical protein
MAEVTLGTSQRTVLSDGKAKDTQESFDLQSWQGLTKILQVARDALTTEEYAEFRDVVLQYAQSKGDAELKKKIDAIIRSFHHNADTKKSESAHESHERLNAHKKQSSAGEKKGHTQESHKKKQERSSETHTKEPAKKHTSRDTKQPQEHTPSEQQAVQKSVQSVPVPENLPVGSVVEESAKKERPASVGIPSKESGKEEVAHRDVPIESQERTGETAPAPQTETPKKQPQQESSGQYKSIDEHKARIAEIKHKINERVGNPVTLIDNGNPLGKQYMMALLEAMRATAGGQTGSLDEKMRTLESIYAELIDYLDHQTTEEEAAMEEKKESEEKITQTAEVKRAAPEADNVKEISQEQKKSENEQIDKTNKVNIEQTVSKREVPKEAPQKQKISREHSISTTRLGPDVSNDSTVPVTEKQEEAEVPRPQQPETISPKVSTAEKLSAPDIPEQKKTEAFKTQSAPPKPFVRAAKQKPSFPGPAKIQIKKTDIQQQGKENVETPEPLEKKASPQETQPKAEESQDYLKGPIVRRPQTPTEPEMPESQQKETYPKRNTSIVQPREEVLDVPTPPKVTGVSWKPSSAAPNTSEVDTVAKPVQQAPNNRKPTENLASSFNPSPISSKDGELSEALDKEENIRNVTDMVDKVTVAQSELNSTEVTEGLEQLLDEWSLFKHSGLLGLGPGGKEHPLYTQLSVLPMSDIMAEKWDGATREKTRVLKDYINAWRNEQGIAYDQNETFEHYLRRVVQRVLKRQNVSI